MSNRELSTDMIDYYIDHLQSLAHYYRDLGNHSRYYHAQGHASPGYAGGGVSGTRSPDAVMINKAQRPDLLDHECSRWLKNLERSLEALYKRKADQNPVHDADARFQQAG